MNFHWTLYCFHFLYIMNDAIFLRKHICFFDMCNFGIYILPVLHDNSIFSKVILVFIAVTTFYIPKNNAQRFQFLHIFANTTIFWFFILVILMGVIHCFDYAFPMINDGKDFSCAFGHLNILKEYQLKFFCHF